MPLPIASLGHDIEPWATVGTAIGTLGLAAATSYLALKTRALSSTSQDELELLRQQAQAALAQSTTAEAALRASIKPVLLDVPPYTLREIPNRLVPVVSPLVRQTGGRSETQIIDASVVSQTIQLEANEQGNRPAYVELGVPVRNVGAGVAMVTQVRLVLLQQCLVLVGKAEARNLPVGEITRLIFSFDEREPIWKPIASAVREQEPLIAAVTYSDSAGGQVSRSEFALLRDGHGRFYVFSARVVDEIEPLPTEAGSAFAEVSRKPPPPSIRPHATS